MSATMTSKTVVHFENEDIQIDVSAPGHYDEFAAMQDAAQVVLKWLYSILPSFATGAIPVEVRMALLDEMGVKECDTESASESAGDSSRASSNEA